MREKSFPYLHFTLTLSLSTGEEPRWEPYGFGSIKLTTRKAA